MDDNELKRQIDAIVSSVLDNLSNTIDAKLRD